MTKRERPIIISGTVAAALVLIASGLMLPVLKIYLETGLVPRFLRRAGHGLAPVHSQRSDTGYGNLRQTRGETAGVFVLQPVPAERDAVMTASAQRCRNHVDRVARGPFIRSALAGASVLTILVGLTDRGVYGPRLMSFPAALTVTWYLDRYDRGDHSACRGLGPEDVRGRGVVTLLVLLALIAIEYLPADRMQANLQASFADGSLQEESDFLRGNRDIGINQYNDCLLVMMARFRTAPLVSAVAPVVIFNNHPSDLLDENGRIATQCSIARRAVFSDEPLEIYKAERYLPYGRYFHAYRIPFNLAITFGPVSTLRTVYEYRV